MIDSVYEAFLASVADEAREINASTSTVRLNALGPPLVSQKRTPRTYTARFQGIEHLVRNHAGAIVASSDPVRVTLHFPLDYCRSVDPQLQFRVAIVCSPLIHPNCKGGLLCLGPYFRPGTGLRPLVEQVYRIIAGRVFATQNAFDAEACSYYLAHLDQVLSLRSQPLWPHRLVTITRLSGRAERASTTRDPQ